MPADACVDPGDPSSWLNFFWIHNDLEYIVKETNKYIAFKNRKKIEIKPKNIAELEKFMGVCMFMATYKLSCPRRYWTEKNSNGYK